MVVIDISLWECDNSSEQGECRAFLPTSQLFCADAAALLRYRSGG